MPTPGSDNSLVYDVRLSSVVPASITGENKVHELTNMDLVMKLHYIKGVYFFKADAVQGFSVNNNFKKSLFQVLIPYYPICGRIRMSEAGGRPYIRCNDSGVRIIEAKCSKTVEEWLELNDSSLNDQLTYNQFFGPDLGFDPLVFIQFTRFKCGGFSIGLSWAHILGDVFSASQFINTWGRQITVAGDQLPPAHHHLDIPPITGSKAIPKVPSCLQKVQLEPEGDKWLISNRCKMQTHSFHITAEHLNNLTKSSPKLGKKKPFEVISAMIWKSLSKVRGNVQSSEPKNITICSYEISNTAGAVSIGNSQMTISTVETSNLKVGISEADLNELANLIAREKVDETSRIEEVLNKKDDDGKCDDFILYGANLTFVNLEGVKIYGLELKGQKSVHASYSLSGIGDEGVVLVLPAGPDNDDDEEEMGRMVNLILREDQMDYLKKELQSEWRIF